MHNNFLPTKNFTGIILSSNKQKNQKTLETAHPSLESDIKLLTDILSSKQTMAAFP